jgi:hypothetical protein
LIGRVAAQSYLLYGPLITRVPPVECAVVDRASALPGSGHHGAGTSQTSQAAVLGKGREILISGENLILV